MTYESAESSLLKPMKRFGPVCSKTARKSVTESEPPLVPLTAKINRKPSEITVDPRIIGIIIGKLNVMKMSLSNGTIYIFEANQIIF